MLVDLHTMKKILYPLCFIICSCSSVQTDEIVESTIPLTTTSEERSCNTIEFNKYYFDNDSIMEIFYERTYHDSVELLNVLGLKALQNEDYTSSVQNLLKACALDSTIAYSFSNLSITYGKLEEYEKAIECLRHAQVLCPTKGITADLGFYLLMNGNIEESGPYLRQAFVLDSMNKKYIGNLMAFYDHTENTDSVLYLLNFISENFNYSSIESQFLDSMTIKYNYDI